MNIGLYISPAHSVPPDEKNILAPWQLVKDLANGLVARKHAVVLFAARGSDTDAVLVHGNIQPAVLKRQKYIDSDSYRPFVVSQELLLFREVIAAAKAGTIDCIHVHQPVERLYPGLAALPPKFPVIITFHDPIQPERFPALEKVFALGNIHMVSLSKSQQQGVPFPFADVVPNGVDTTIYKPDSGGMGTRGSKGKDRRPLLITGRIVQQKGFAEAIAIAKRAKIRLLMVGQEYEKRKIPREYFQEEVRPHIDGKTVIWESIVKQDHLIGHYQTARALLFPIQWEEPFGLTMIEAMACGTPVIAYDRGSVSEIVRDGMTGFIIQNTSDKSISNTSIQKKGIDGFIEAIQRIDEIDRSFCVRHVAEHFTLERMIDRYEALYGEIVNSQ